ncbi:hypothetical protein SDC9_208482 [bioreactor metagenome]|uniref:Uncharacterized protein n=1 Tax=bioreactor metagenome TaxID=1076179 RepID=A0A645JCG5_9ZZZZ
MRQADHAVDALHARQVGKGAHDGRRPAGNGRGGHTRKAQFPLHPQPLSRIHDAQAVPAEAGFAQAQGERLFPRLKRGHTQPIRCLLPDIPDSAGQDGLDEGAGLAIARAHPGYEADDRVLVG